MNTPGKKQPLRAPWASEDATQWLASFEPWTKAIRLIHGTLQLDAQKHPQEVRAATAMVILFCREGLWPIKESELNDSTLELAVRQLSTIKQLYELNVRRKPELLKNKSYRELLVSIDQEIRLLEARMSDSKASMPNEPPCSWGEFWV